MSKLTIGILALALAPQLSWGQSLMEMVRSKGFEVPSVGAGAPITLADFRTVPNPDYQDPDKKQPPHLTKEHASKLIELMVNAELAQRPGLKDASQMTLTREDVMRLIANLALIDRRYVDAIPGAVWDKAIADMGAVAAKEFRFQGGKGNWEETIHAMINATAKKLLDPHSVYWNREEFNRFQDEMNNTFVGVGVVLREDGSIESVVPGGPAEKAGLKAGDKITAVDGQVVSGRAQAVKLLRGQAKTSVRVTVQRGTFAVIRDEIKTKNVFAKMAAADVGYVHFGQFSPDCDKELIAAISELQVKGARKLVIDVRGNPGGTVDSVSQIASEFFKDGQKIVSFKQQGVEMYRNVTKGDGKFVDMPVVILVNGGSASASEILAGALQDVRGPVVVGSRSYGKGTMQGVMPDSQGRALKLTMGRWYTPRDRSIDARHDANGQKIKGTGGVIPDYLIVLTEEQERAIMGQVFREMQGYPAQGARVDDPVLKKALELLGR